MTVRAGFLALALGLSIVLSACGDKTEAKPDPSAAAQGSSKPAGSAAATSTAGAATSAAAKKKDDSGW